MADVLTFTCAQCGQTFKCGRPDEEARREAVDLFGARAPGGMAIVCEDCFVEIMARVLRDVPTN